MTHSTVVRVDESAVNKDDLKKIFLSEVPTEMYPEIERKLDLFFTKLNEMPYWLVGLWISIVAAIYGIKATDIIKTKK